MKEVGGKRDILLLKINYERVDIVKVKKFITLIFFFATFYLFNNVSFGEQLSTEQQALDFMNKSNSVIKNMNEEVAKKTILLQQALSIGDKKAGYRIEEEIRDLIYQHRQQIELLDAPAICNELKSIDIKWMRLQEDMHDALARGNIQKSKLLAGQVVEYFYKMKTELEHILKYYNTGGL